MTLFSPRLLRHRAKAPSSLSFALALTLGLASLGWQNPAGASPDKAAVPAAPVASHPQKPASPTRDARADVMLIKGLTPGDTACYVELRNARGKRSEEMASFELCEQTKLIGQRVRLTRKPERVMAASCQGNPDCTKTQTVNLIVKAEKVR